MRLNANILFAFIAVSFIGENALAAEYPSVIVFPIEQEEYLACGCGCCSGMQPRDQCLYRSKGETLEKIIEENEKIAKDGKHCATAGCSLPVRYHYCDSPK